MITADSEQWSWGEFLRHPACRHLQVLHIDLRFGAPGCVFVEDWTVLLQLQLHTFHAKCASDDPVIAALPTLPDLTDLQLGFEQAGDQLTDERASCIGVCIRLQKLSFTVARDAQLHLMVTAAMEALADLTLDSLLMDESESWMQLATCGVSATPPRSCWAAAAA